MADRSLYNLDPGFFPHCHCMLPPVLKLLLSPRNWLPGIGLAILWLVNLLPYPIKIRLGLGFGGLLHKLLRNRRRIAAINLKLCFPDRTAEQRDDILHRAYRHLGAGLIETAMSWWTPAHKIQAITQVEGLEHLQAATQQGKGLIMIGAHFSCLDIGAKMINPYQQFHVVQRRQKNPMFNYVMQKGRAAATLSVVDNREVRKIVKIVRDGGAIWLAPDHDMGEKGAVYAPFFSQPAATITAPAKFIRLTGAPAIFCATHRRADNSGYLLRISPVPEDIATLDDEPAATLLNSIIADNISHDVAQYYWFHRRFKSQSGQPKGALYKRSGGVSPAN